MVGDAWQRVAGLAGARDRRAQLTIVHRGEVVVDLAIGCGDSALFWLFSAGKPFITVLTERLAERGLLDLDAPVARYWSEFGRSGKEGITLRQVLAHRTGMPTAGSAIGDVLTMPSWARLRRRIVAARPRLDPARGPAYQFVVYGAILGEVLQRVTGRPLAVLLSDEVLAPLMLSETFLGLPRDLGHRAVSLRFEGPGGRAAAGFVNRRAVREAVIPSAGVSTTSRDLARFYSGLLASLRGDRGALLSSGTVERMISPTSDGQEDLFARAPLRWGEGVQLGGPRPGGSGAMGLATSARAFGHNGSNACLGWADPDRDLVLAYVTDLVPRPAAGVAHLATLSDAVIAAADATG
jgi:CubicO group peptidase (beta-lactamase class C family)